MEKKNEIKIYIGEPIPGKRKVPVLNEYFKFEPGDTRLYRDFFDNLDFSFLKITDNPKEADFLFLPHPYFMAFKKKENGRTYMEEFLELAEKYDKKIIGITYGDSDAEFDIPERVYMFRTSQYGYKKKENEIIMPPYVGDLLPDSGLKIREKKEKPVVSFCGWANLANKKLYIKYLIKIWIKYFWFFLGEKKAPLHIQGLYYRRKMINVMKKSSLIKTSFLIRNFFGRNKSTIKMSPEKAREEYVENIVESDFVLSVKGDGNFSVRFYEILALGRIPVLLDTDCILPLSETLNYKDFIVFVGYKNMKEAPKKVANFYNSLSDEKYKEIQEKARNAFENYLRIDSFFKFKLNQLNI